MPEQRLDLAKMAQGAFMEQFHGELTQVLANIADPNTDSELKDMGIPIIS